MPSCLTMDLPVSGEALAVARHRGSPAPWVRAEARRVVNRADMGGRGLTGRASYLLHCGIVNATSVHNWARVRRRRESNPQFAVLETASLPKARRLANKAEFGRAK